VARVLVADDDGHIREVVRFALEREGHRVVEAEDGARALERFRADSADLIVLDIVMPERDGLDVCRTIRQSSQVPILFLSSRDEELDRILGLEMGADDYVTKPFSPRERAARVMAMLRRASAPRSEPSQTGAALRHGPLALDVERHECRWESREVFLTATEFLLLHSLLRAPGRVYARSELVERAYGDGHHITERTVDSHIRRIRHKFAVLGADPIETIYGVGYRLRPDPV
jgi:two-component system, OmpR family, response regulator